jgi:hypothetical protein
MLPIGSPSLDLTFLFTTLSQSITDGLPSAIVLFFASK